MTKRKKEAPPGKVRALLQNTVLYNGSRSAARFGAGSEQKFTSGQVSGPSSILCHYMVRSVRPTQARCQKVPPSLSQCPQRDSPFGWPTEPRLDRPTKRIITQFSEAREEKWSEIKKKNKRKYCTHCEMMTPGDVVPSTAEHWLTLTADRYDQSDDISWHTHHQLICSQF